MTNEKISPDLEEDLNVEMLSAGFRKDEGCRRKDFERLSIKFGKEKAISIQALQDEIDKSKFLDGLIGGDGVPIC